MMQAHRSATRHPRRGVSARCGRAAIALLALAVVPALPGAATASAQGAPGEREWQAGIEAARRGDDARALTAFREALAIARRERDPGLASAARLGMAEVYDVWWNCRDSARVAYAEATALAAPGDFAAPLAEVRFLARTGRRADADALLTRTFDAIGADVPNTITHESVEYLIGRAAVQRAAGNLGAARGTLRNARDIAARLAVGDDTSATVGVTRVNYWVLADQAALRLDARSPAADRASGAALRDSLDAAADEVNDDGAIPRFTTARLRERVERARRACGAGACAVPEPPTTARCP